jgi:predicted DNA-binding WGR domain protein
VRVVPFNPLVDPAAMVRKRNTLLAQLAEERAKSRRGSLMIKLTRIDRANNMHRFYALQLGTTLFGEHVLIAEWGRVQERVFISSSDAQAMLEKRQAAKIRRGYTVTAV